MIGMTVQLSGLDSAKAALGRLLSGLSDQATVNETVESAASAAVQDHLSKNYAKKTNKLGGKSTGYWGAVTKSVTAASDGELVTISITGRGLRLRFEGGTIKPSGRISEATGKPIRFLAFPVHPSVYGQTPAEVSMELYAKADDEGPGLFEKRGEERSDSDRKLFALARSTTHKEDPNILPSAEKVGAACITALEDLVEGLTDVEA